MRQSSGAFRIEGESVRQSARGLAHSKTLRATHTFRRDLSSYGLGSSFGLDAEPVLASLGSPMKPKRLVLVVAFALFAGMLALAWFMFGGRTPPVAALPSPNGYEDFLKAGTLAAETSNTNAEASLADFQQLEPAELRAALAANAEALGMLRLGLSRQCAIPVDAAAGNVNGMLVDLGNLKRLSLILGAEGWLAELENRPADAALSYADCIQLGNDLSRGGFIINRLVGVACEARGCAALAKLLPRLKPEESRAVLRRLLKIEESRVSWEEVMRGENRFARIQLGKAYNPITWLVARWQARKAVEKGEARHKRIVAQERLLAVELALRCHQADKGSPPGRLEELVPAYLPAVLADPFSGLPLTYHPRGTNWLLYSFGTDQKDDGGTPIRGGLTNKGDLFLDSPH